MTLKLNPADGMGTHTHPIANAPPSIQPVAFTLREGDDWKLFKRWAFSGAVHAILFDTGDVFDVYNGWREKKDDHEHKDLMDKLWKDEYRRRGYDGEVRKDD